VDEKGGHTLPDRKRNGDGNGYGNKGRIWSGFRKEQGSLVLEAALTLPFFLAFIVALVLLIRIAMVETALQSSVSETVKVVATHMYPVQLMFDEARSGWEESRAAAVVEELRARMQNALEKARQSADFVDDYAAFVPETLLPLIELAKRWQEEEQQEGLLTDLLADYVTDPLLNAAFTPLLHKYADRRKLDTGSLKVTKVVFPSLKDKNHAFIGIEATYTMDLPIPFFPKRVQLVKRAYERLWVGA
jgi:hypothetical protein